VRVVLIILGLAIATAGGVVAYRAWFIDPRTTVVISDSGIREVPKYSRIIAGLLMFLIGFTAAYLAARRRRV
jgi:hypothetical protein